MTNCVLASSIFGGSYTRSNKLDTTTETELSAMARPAIHGGSMMPVNGYNTPAAMGIISTL